MSNPRLEEFLDKPEGVLSGYRTSHGTYCVGCGSLSYNRDELGANDLIAIWSTDVTTTELFCRRCSGTIDTDVQRFVAYEDAAWQSFEPHASVHAQQINLGRGVPPRPFADCDNVLDFAIMVQVHFIDTAHWPMEAARKKAQKDIDTQGFLHAARTGNIYAAIVAEYRVKFWAQVERDLHAMDDQFSSFVSLDIYHSELRSVFTKARRRLFEQYQNVGDRYAFYGQIRAAMKNVIADLSYVISELN